MDFKEAMEKFRESFCSSQYILLNGEEEYSELRKEKEMYFPGNWDENCPDELKVENCKTDFVYVDSKNCKCFVIKFQIDSCYFWNDRLITMMNDAIQNFIKQNGCRNVKYYTSGKQEFQYFNFIFFGCAKIGDE